MKKIFLLLSILTMLFVTPSITLAEPLLGPATGYNAFVFGELDVNNSDSKGRFAAGGNMDLEFYGVGGDASPAEYTIVGGADVDFYSGTVSNGGIFAAGNLYLDHHTIYGNVVANGDIIYGPGNGTVFGTATANAGAQSPVDFSTAHDSLSATSAMLKDKDVNGDTLVEYVTNITFTSNADVNVFYLDGADLNNANVINFNMGIDDIAIINVSGTTGDHFTSLGMTGTYDPSNILWNFYEATDLTLNTTVQGSILAPFADVTFNNGNLWGTLVAGSMTGTGEFHMKTFEHDIAPVPEPSTLVLLGSGMVGLLGIRRKAR